MRLRAPSRAPSALGKPWPAPAHGVEAPRQRLTIASKSSSSSPPAKGLKCHRSSQASDSVCNQPPLERCRVKGLEGYLRGKCLQLGSGDEWMLDPLNLIGDRGDTKELQYLICPKKQCTALGKHKATEMPHWISLGFNPKLTLL